MTTVKSQASKFDFNKVDSIQKSIQYTVYGFIRRIQEMLPSNNPYYNIPKLITFIVLFYYNSTDTFDVNNDTIFNFISSKHGYAYHIFGVRIIERKYVKEYEWKIKIKGGSAKNLKGKFGGTIGIVDDTKGASLKINNGRNLEYYNDVIVVGSNSGNWPGTLYGLTNWGDQTTRFIQPNDTITINVNFEENSICFKSKEQNKSVIKKLKTETEIIKLVIEFGGADCTVSLI